MGRHYHRTSLGSPLLKQLFNGADTAGINGGKNFIQQPERLVGNQQARFAGQRTRDTDTLALEIAEEAGITERTVRYARKKLRLKGAIEPIAYEKGGRGKSTIYKFPWVEKGGNNDRVSDENNTKRGKYSARKGGNNAPPYNSSSNYKKASPSRGQVDKVHLETEYGKWNVQRLHELCERMGYGEAKAQLDREIAEKEQEGEQA